MSTQLELDQHFTHKHVADFMATLVPLTARRVLEPSAGDGGIADSLVEAGFTPDVVEIDPFYAKRLEEKDYKLVGNNFLNFETDEPYDMVVMNPPYSGGADTEHVAHALKVGREVLALVRINIFASKSRYEKIWSNCNLIGFYPYAARPKFGGYTGTLRHDICVVHLQSHYHTEDCQEPVDFRVVGE